MAQAWWGSIGSHVLIGSLSACFGLIIGSFLSSVGRADLTARLADAEAKLAAQNRRVETLSRALAAILGSAAAIELNAIQDGTIQKAKAVLRQLGL